MTGHAPHLALVGVALALAACPSARPDGPRANTAVKPASTPCRGLDESQCHRAHGLLRAASTFGNVKHDYLLDAASSIAPGRGVQRSAEGTWSVLPTRCGEERGAESAPKSRSVDASTIDFSYVGVSIDQHLVSADADLAPWLGAGAEGAERRVSLVAIAFVRDLDPQFFAASPAVSYSGEECTCGRATHFVGAVKVGGVMSYELRVRSAELRGRALDFVKARMSAGDAQVTQTIVGGLEVDGLETMLAASPPASPQGARPLAFRVKNPVPVAYAVYPLSDICRFAFPAPEVSPEIVEFGDVPYGREATRLLHVVNRASIDLRATIGERTFAVPALGSADVPFEWKPEGQSLGCEALTREETLEFLPRDANAPVIPRKQSVRLVARARSGKESFRRHEHVDTGVSRKPEYAKASREWTCPPDYALASCRSEALRCGDGPCKSDGYAVNAEPTERGCRFGCTGPEGFLPGLSSNFCSYDAVMECRLRCR